VFKRGGRFEIPYVVDFEGSLDGPVSCPRAGVCEAGEVRIPDTWGFGVGYRPSGRWLLSADASLVRYSQLSATIFRAIPFDIYPIPEPTNNLPPSEFRDVVQLHGGAERIFAGNPTVGVRAGLYHRPNFNRDSAVDAGATFFTGGLGLVFGDRGQLDLAGAVSGGVSEGLASVVIRF
jgi:long-subunit fatty acid transport protein